MKLDKPLILLPLKFDVGRLMCEVNQFAEDDWVPHPQGYSGNSAIRLITQDGDENDETQGHMKPTKSLQDCPYIQQVLSSFKVVCGRSRLMKLKAGSKVPPHSDLNHYWFNRVRIHIPIITTEDVLFNCDNETVHMKAGEAWVFDNWRVHSVENNSSIDRIHLVVDTVGASEFWDMVAFASTASLPLFQSRIQTISYDYSSHYNLMTERYTLEPIMNALEMRFLLEDIMSDITVEENVEDGENIIRHFKYMLESLCRDWQALKLVLPNKDSSFPQFNQLLKRTLNGLQSLPNPVIMKSNRLLAIDVVLSRVLKVSIAPGALEKGHQSKTSGPPKQTRCLFEKPIFIVSSPRSGSTLLFETLSNLQSLYSIGKESHSIFESIKMLRPGGGNVTDNRLTKQHLTEDIKRDIHLSFESQLQNFQGQHIIPSKQSSIRFLEKTPKNSLRIPFIKAMYPDALFIYLYREPQASISSIIDAWQSGKWVTYQKLPNRAKPWSLLLPPGWEIVSNAPIEEIAAFQWIQSNQTIMKDLEKLEARDYHVLTYDSFLAQPKREVENICRFIDVNLDEHLEKILDSPLPNSRYTLTRPQKNKWERNSHLINRVRNDFSETECQFARFFEMHNNQE